MVSSKPGIEPRSVGSKAWAFPSVPVVARVRMMVLESGARRVVNMRPHGERFGGMGPCSPVCQFKTERLKICRGPVPLLCEVLRHFTLGMVV